MRRKRRRRCDVGRVALLNTPPTRLPPEATETGRPAADSTTMPESDSSTFPTEEVPAWLVQVAGMLVSRSWDVLLM
jgi:hypothetical protein